MRNSLDYQLDGNRTVLDVLWQVLQGQGVDCFRVVDVGARNGMFLLPASYIGRCELVGFEPNPVEYQKLLSGNTDAAKSGNVFARSPRERMFNSAAWNVDGTGTFYVTEGPGACTMMGEVVVPVAGRLYQRYPATDARSGKSFYECHGAVKNTLEVPTQRIDSVLQDEIVDFLKIDVEGGELRVMQGAERLFERRQILFIYTEFVALPYYREHPLLGDQHAFLRDRGFRLLDLELGHSGYSRDRTTIGADADRPLLHAGDAIFALDPDTNDLSPVLRLRLAAIALAFGFNSFGVSLLREAKLLPPEQITAIEQALSHVPLPRRLARSWRRLPNRVAALLAACGIAV